jgi:CubicO group peptidase (beta-lactamase class C family)
MKRCILFSTLALLLMTFSTGASAQGGPPPQVRSAISGIVVMVESEGDDALRQFADKALAEVYRKSFSSGELLHHLQTIRDAAHGHTGAVSVMRSPDGGLTIVLGEDQGVRVGLMLDDRFLITKLELAKGSGESRPPAAVSDSPRPPAGGGKQPATSEEARPFHVRALSGPSEMDAAGTLAMLERDHFSAEYLQRTSRTERLDLVGKIRAAAASASTILVNEDGEGVHIHFDESAGPIVSFTIDTRAPFRISSLGLAPPSASKNAAGPAMTWDGLSNALSAAESAGFSGQVLVRHNGSEVLRKTYGMADREARRATAPSSIYCIGSAPIDFTITAAQLLVERGKLHLDDPIGRYLPDVPADKASLTIGMILDGKSGLPNFHHTNDDWDADLGWIDRSTAVRRILSKPLLFAPGARREHSHSAYGLLAAIIEIVSGQTYRDFIRAEILRPLGMARTGFYGESLNLPVDSFAAGYGVRSVGVPNIPPNWGPTSWLVMGSGGMFSTLDDLRRYYDGLASGALFASKKARPQTSFTVNGSERGFYFSRIDNGKGDQVYVLSNTETSPALKPLVNGFAKLVLGPNAG